MPGVHHCFTYTSPFLSISHYRFPSVNFYTRTLLTAILVGALLLSPSVSSAQAASDETRLYRIPAGSLEDALNTFAMQAGITLTFDPALVEGKTVQGLDGMHTLTEAMGILLKNSGLEASRNDEGSYHLKPLPLEGEREVAMPSMYVEGEAISDPGVESVSIDRIQRNRATDMKDVFRSESSIEIGGGSRAAQRIYVRGIEATNLNVTVDGANQGMNHFQHCGNIGGINPDLLKQVEVQTTPSADQGPGALGGSIRFETVDAQDLLPADKHVGTILRGGLSSVDRGDLLGGSLFGRAGKHLGVLFNYSESTFEPYLDGDGNQIVGSEGEDKNLFFKMSLLDMAGHSLRASYENQKDQGLYTGDWTYGDGTGRTPTNQTSERDTYVVDYRFRALNNDLIDWKLNAYQNESTLERSTVETLSDGYGLDARNTARFSIGPTDHALTVGVDWSAEKGEEIDDPTEIEAENTGLYLQNRMTFSRLGVSFGARFDDYDTTFGNVDISGSEISPNAGVDINLGWGFSGFAAYGEATRAKGIIPIGWLVDITDDAVVNQEEGKESFGKEMQPETSTTYQYGLRYGTEGLFMDSDHLQAQATLFDTEIENLITQVGGRRGTPVTGLYNDDPITTQGYELKLGWGVKGVDTNFSFTHAVTEDADGKAIAFSRRKAASAGDTLVWDTFWRLNPVIGFGYTLKYVAALERDEIDRDGYTLHNAQVVVTPDIVNGLTLTVAVLNLTDEFYRSQASSGEDDTATPEPGRDIRVGLTYKMMF